MIAWRHLSSVSFSSFDRLWRVAVATDVVVLRNPTLCTEVCLCNRGGIRKMSGVKDRSRRTDQKVKQKTDKPVWRSISTQSNSSKVRSSINLDDEGQIGAMHCMCTSSGSQGITHDIEPTSNVTSLNSRFNVLDTQDLGPTSNVSGSPKSRSNILEHIDENKVEGNTSISVTIETEEVFFPENAPHEELIDVAHESQLEASVELSSGAEKHSISIEVSTHLIRFVKGKFGFTQRQIEGETGVKLIFPSSEAETAITIEGVSIENVVQASEKIRIIIKEAVKSRNLDYSHFISLPLAIHGELVEKLNNFQNCILGEPNLSENGSKDINSDEDLVDDNDVVLLTRDTLEFQEKHVKVASCTPSSYKSYSSNHQLQFPSLTDLGIDRSIFIKPKTLHLTVLMLKLYDKDTIASAIEILQRISSKVRDALDNRPIFIRLKGLACMRGSPSKARVVYAPVEEIGGEDRLMHACRIIIDAYLEAGLVSKEDAQQGLKLHATLMNARHKKRKKNTKTFHYFDARDIFKRYESEEWGEYLIQEAHLSQRFKYDEKGYYHCCASIPFPEYYAD